MEREEWRKFRVYFKAIIQKKKSMSLISYRPHSLDGNNKDLHFITLDVPNSKFKLHRTHKS